MKRAIRKHSGDFAAIVILLVLSIGVAGYILAHERLRFPILQSPRFELNAEVATAQAVTPGQGQSVRVSGVQVGEIGGVSLRRGVAVVQMNIDQQYRHLIHTDATALLRPRTGLKDMFIEVNPGSPGTPTAQPGYTIPVANTLPDVNVDEILASLDADTRAYLQLLINGAGQGLAHGGGNELAGVLERFEPTHRDLARLNGALAARGANLRRLVHSLRRLTVAVAARQHQLSQLVDSSSAVFRAFASEQHNVSQSIADLPATLSQTTTTLGEVQTFANELGPTATNLLPAASALPAANRALIHLAGRNAVSCGSGSSCLIVKSQIRPFVIAAGPVVNELAPAASNLATATPNLQRAFVVVNHLLNMLGYAPGGGQHGYLWWLAWLGHNTRTLFSVQDANGPYRPLFIQFSCSQIALLSNPGSPFALVGGLLNLAPTRPFCGLTPAQDRPTRAKR